MGKLYITEFQGTGIDSLGREMQAAKEPSLGTQIVDFAASVQSATLNAATTLVRVHTDSTCHVTFGTNPTATTSNRRMVSDQTEYFVVQANSGLKIAAINGV